MIKSGLSTVLLGLAVVSTIVSAKEYTIGEVVSGVGGFFGGLTGSGTSNVPSGILVKDLPDLPKLTDKPFLRGLAKFDYSEIDRHGPSSKKNMDMIGWAAADGIGCLRLLQNGYNTHPKVAINFQNDAKNGKTFIHTNPVSGFSNPYANDKKAFDLSSLNEVTRVNHQTIYTYTLKTHFKIPDEFVKNGKFVFESETTGIRYYTQDIKGTMMKSQQMCYEMINGQILNDKKATYTAQKGNIVDYQTTCYFGGTNGKNDKTNMIQSITPFNEVIPSSWKVYSVSDPLAKDAGKSYALTNRDMFLYENEVYPVK